MSFGNSTFLFDLIIIVVLIVCIAEIIKRTSNVFVKTKKVLKNMVVSKQSFFNSRSAEFISITLIFVLVGSVLMKVVGLLFSDMVKIFLLVLATQLIAGWYAKKQVIRAYNEKK